MFAKRINNVEELVKAFVLELEKHIQVDLVILFGSYSRGKPRDFSDIDIAVISPDFEGGTEKDCLLLDRIARRIHPLIEAIPYNSQDFKNFESGDFVDQILKTGRVIFKRAA